MTVASPPNRQSSSGTWFRRPAIRLGEERVCRAALLAGMAVYVALALWLTRGTTLFFDETNIFTVDRGFRPAALLAPLNGHLVLLQRLIYATSFKLFGAEFLVLRLVEVGGVALVVGLFFRAVKGRIGADAALAPAFLLLFFGSAWELNFVVSGIGNVYAVAAGLGALLVLERSGSRRDLVACLLLLVAIASFTTGVAFAIGAAVLIVLQSGRWRRLWVPLLPLALYAGWLVWIRAVYVPANGEVQDLELWNVLLIPNFIADEAAAVAGAVAGLNYDFEPDTLIPVFSTDSPYGALLAALALWALVVRLRSGHRSSMLWALISILIAFWAALALGFGTGRNPSTVRYVYGGAIVVLLIAAEAARGVRLSRSGLLVLYALTALALCTNLARLREGTDFYRTFATSLRADLTAIELAREQVDPSFVPPAGSLKTAVVRAGPYLDAVQRIGSPAYSPAELSRRPEAERAGADSVLVAALGIALATRTSGVGTASCRRPARGPGSSSTFAVEPPGVTLSSPTGGKVALRRFASVTTIPLDNLPDGRPVDLQIPADRSRRTWHASVASAPESLRVCDLRPS